MSKDQGYAWVVCAASFLIQVMIGGFRYTSGIFYIMFKNGIDASDSSLSLITSLNIGISYIVCPAVGMLSDRYGERSIAILGAFLSTVGLAASAFTTQVYQLYIFYSIFAGVGTGMTYNPCISILSKYFSRHRRMACACAMCGLGAGSFIIPPLLKALEEYYGWRGAILILAGINSHNIILCCTFRPTEEHQKEERDMDADIEEEVLKVVNRGQVLLNGTGTKTDVNNEKTLAQCDINKSSSNVNNLNSSTISMNNITSEGKFQFTGQIDMGACYKSSSDVDNLYKSSGDMNELNRCSNNTKGIYKGSSDVKGLSKSSSGLEICTEGPQVSATIAERLLSLFRTIPFICTNLCSLFIQFTVAIVYTHFGYYVLTLGYSGSNVVELYMVTGIISTICRPLIGFLAQATNANAAAFILITSVANGIMTAALPLTTNLVLMYVYIVMFSVLLTPYMVLSASFIMESVPGNQASTGYGVLCFFCTPGSVLGAPLAALLYGSTHMYDYSFYLAGGLMVMGGLTMSPPAYTVYKNRRQQ